VKTWVEPPNETKYAADQYAEGSHSLHVTRSVELHSVDADCCCQLDDT
jgi:hypothetical protein